MRFFDLFKKKSDRKEFFLRWQNTVIPNSSNQLMMTEQQLNEITLQQAENDLRIIKDCIKMIETTLKPDVFFMRLNMLVEKAQHLCNLEEFISFSGSSPSEGCAELVENYQEAIKQFLIRYFSDTFDKAEAMKTEKGKMGKYKKFYDSLQEYYIYMNDNNKDYVETKFRAYTKTLRG